MDEQLAAKVAMVLARCIESLEENIADLRAEVAEIRAANPITPPKVQTMIVSALEYAAPKGLTRGDISKAIFRDFGVTVSENTLTGTLARMHAAKLIRRNGQTWFIM